MTNRTNWRRAAAKNRRTKAKASRDIEFSRLGGGFGHVGRARGADQLGPDAVPVDRAQIPAADGAAGGLFDGSTALSRGATPAIRNL